MEGLDANCSIKSNVTVREGANVSQHDSGCGLDTDTVEESSPCGIRLGGKAAKSFVTANAQK